MANKSWSKQGCFVFVHTQVESTSSRTLLVLVLHLLPLCMCRRPLLSAVDILLVVYGWDLRSGGRVEQLLRFFLGHLYVAVVRAVLRVGGACSEFFSFHLVWLVALNTHQFAKVYSKEVWVFAADTTFQKAMTS